jgi:hypothetical protein
MQAARHSFLVADPNFVTCKSKYLSPLFFELIVSRHFTGVRRLIAPCVVRIAVDW